LIYVLYLLLIIFLVGYDVPIDNETFLVTDFINLKIKPAQSFRDVHIDRIYVYKSIQYEYNRRDVIFF
jgi:hypothetical protein